MIGEKKLAQLAQMDSFVLLQLELSDGNTLVQRDLTAKLESKLSVPVDTTEPWKEESLKPQLVSLVQLDTIAQRELTTTMFTHANQDITVQDRVM